MHGGRVVRPRKILEAASLLTPTIVKEKFPSNFHLVLHVYLISMILNQASEILEFKVLTTVF